MSGTAFGTIVLHITPESHLGGPLALVKNGDLIRLSAAQKTLELLVDAETLQQRRTSWRKPHSTAARGYGRLYERSVLPATKGCDFDFLRAAAPAPQA